MHQLQRHHISSSFHSVGLRPDIVPLGHVLNIDHFHMSQPTFPPHPHAGFSAVTWMLPWSKGGFINRDSLGDRSRIGPGSLHWTLAGSGMLHEEIPEAPGVDCEGLQIFVKLTEHDELSPPRAFQLNETQIPTLERPGANIRVLVGDVDGISSPIPLHDNTTMAHVTVTKTWAVSIPEDVDAFAMVLRGAGYIQGHRAEAHQAVALPNGEAFLEGDGMDVLLGWSGRLPQKPSFDGPFSMFHPDRLADAYRRFRSGQMGSLQPSAVSWSRS